MSLLHSESFRRRVLGHLVCRADQVDDRFALSFDDGPSRRFTPALVDVLDRLGVRATFFMLGVHVLLYPEVAKRVMDNGHEVGLHGNRHLPPLLLPRSWLLRELEMGARAIATATGSLPRFYRPPFGALAPGQARLAQAQGLVPVLGDVYPRDHARPGSRRIAERALSRLRSGSILILHDGSAVGDFDRSQTIAAAEHIVREMNTRGVRAVTVGELLSPSA